MIGYREIEHTADWELEVWAPDLSGLLEQAALGMMSLAGVRLQAEPRLEREVSVSADGPENLIVAFLSEILYILEAEGNGFDQLEVQERGDQVFARLSGAPLASIDKEIKAVTFHNLAVQPTLDGVKVNIVFDV